MKHKLAIIQLFFFIIAMIAGGFFLYTHKLYNHEKSFFFTSEDSARLVKDNKQINILFIGTCFIANDDEPNTIFFPKLIQQKLEQISGKKVNIVIKASSGLSSATAAKSIDSWLDESPFDLVIVSLGSGDFYNNLFYKPGLTGKFQTFIDESNLIRTVRLQAEKLTKKSIHTVVVNLEQNKITEVEKTLENAPRDSRDYFVQALYLCRLYYEFDQIEKGQKLLRSLKFDNHLDPKLLAEITYNLYLFNLTDEAKKITQDFKQLPQSFQYMQNNMSKEGLPLDQTGKEITLLKYMDNKELFPALSYNYNILIQKIKSRGVIPIVLQYPKRSNDLLKKVLTEHPETEIVDNEQLFVNAEKTYGYNKIYANNWFGDFGTLTNLGHEIISDNIVHFLTEYHAPLLKKDDDKIIEK